MAVRSPIETMGYQLEPGTVIIPSIYLAHHQEEVYPQPKQFRPECFLERQFSQYEMKLVLATIIDYTYQKVFICHVLTHAEYDKEE